MAWPDRLRMQPHDPRLPLAVSVELRRDASDAVPRQIDRPNGGRKQDSVSGSRDAMVQLEVLVRENAFVIAADVRQHTSAKGPEVHRLHELLPFRVVEAAVADPEFGAEGKGHRLADSALAPRAHETADVGRPALRQQAH